MNPADEFYIGWEDAAPPGIRRTVRRAVILLLVLAVGLTLALAAAQRTIGKGVFEWGTVKEFTGILKSRPYPQLLVPRPGAGTSQPTYSSYYLVKPFKFGFDTSVASRLDGQIVRLEGTLIYRGNQTMIEVADNSIRPSDVPAAPGDSLSAGERAAKEKAEILAIAPVSLGRQTLVGEIVDSKCYLGVMNPGALIPHRACAIRCISGGIPPVLLVRQANGAALYFLLVARDGSPVNKDVLSLVAEPVEITGEVERQGDLLVLRAESRDYRRVTN